MAKKDIIEREAQYGQKMIEIRVRFFTNDIAEQEGKIVPKHAWTSGVVRLQKNKAHGISGSEPEAFNSLMELMPAIETILIDQGIILHKSRKMKKYFSNL